MKNILSLLIASLMSSAIVMAQDIQYSQYYANALNLSPAFAGANQTSRVIAHARLQWPALDATYVGSTFSFDHYFERVKSGVGLVINTDQMNAYTNKTFRNLEVGLQYAYQLELSKDWSFRPGLQLSYVQRSFDSNSLTWDQQFDNDGWKGGPSGEESILPDAPINHPDVGAGGLLYSDRLWVGISANHLNRPSASFLRDGTNKVDIKTTLHAGMKFYVGGAKRSRYGFDDSGTETSISPVMLYKMQGKSDQLDIGAYFRYNALIVGSWYRGIPVKVYSGETFNNDAMVVMLGAVVKGLNVGYSYDFTISKLNSIWSGGSHEISLTYNFLVESYPQKKRSKGRKPVCPKF